MSPKSTISPVVTHAINFAPFTLTHLTLSRFRPEWSTQQISTNITGTKDRQEAITAAEKGQRVRWEDYKRLVKEYQLEKQFLVSPLTTVTLENAALKKGASAGIRMKVSEKGAVSIYGMGRFPVTLYKEQWLKLLDMAADIRAFIAANEAQLKAKD